MNWSIVNVIAASPAIVSLGVLIITMRKLARTIRLWRELTYQIKLATLNLDQAVSLLRNEHQSFRNESYKLDTRIRETIRIRHDIGCSLAHMEQMHNQLQQKFNELPMSADKPVEHSYYASPIPITTTPRPQKHEKNGLPVFVQRKVSKAGLKNAVKP